MTAAETTPLKDPRSQTAYALQAVEPTKRCVPVREAKLTHRVCLMRYYKGERSWQSKASK